jgi:2-hydroxy-6-oxonona-2,4-dienedioate hydrolase
VRRRSRIAAAVAALSASAVAGEVARRYLRDVREARRRVSRSRIAETPLGPIEYCVAGDGPAVLVVHGAGGGFDQGLDIAEPVARSGFRLVAPSRFGYLRTPVPEDASPAAQADAHAALLDALGILKAAVIGASAGAPSAIQLALRHPDRVSALVLLVPATYPTRIGPDAADGGSRRIPAAAGFLLSAALRSDFLFWLAWRAARPAMIRAVLGTPPSVMPTASAAERARALSVAEHILPISARRIGLLNDAAVVGSLPRYELERIESPTLVVGLRDDLYGTWDGARYTAEHVRGARFVGYPTGGHLFVGRGRQVVEQVVEFLKESS